YAFPVANGAYTVRLHFAENYSGITGVGQRVFSVDVEGTRIADLDVFRETGGRNRALVKSATVKVADGSLTIAFLPQIENPEINGIEIVASGTSTCTPTTCAAQGKNCGTINDGCGGTLACGSCAAPQTCGGSGLANVCGAAPSTSSCTIYVSPNGGASGA